MLGQLGINCPSEAWKFYGFEVSASGLSPFDDDYEYCYRLVNNTTGEIVDEDYSLRSDWPANLSSNYEGLHTIQLCVLEDNSCPDSWDSDNPEPFNNSYCLHVLSCTINIQSGSPPPPAPSIELFLLMNMLLHKLKIYLRSIRHIPSP